MIVKPLQDLVESDLESLVEQGREEGTQLDFKRDLPKEDSDGRKAFFSDICAFANTSGGDLVYGMDEVDGVATTLVPQILPMQSDAYILKLTSSIRDNIEPVLYGVHIKVVELVGRGHALVIRVPRSFSGTHRYKKDGQFYVRKSRSNDQLDVPGLVSRIADRLGREDRVESFFARRYADIFTGEHAIAMESGPKLVVHLLPARDFLSGEEIDLTAIPENNQTPFLSDALGSTNRNSFDGRVFYNGSESTTSFFTLFMRSGVIESCMDLIPTFWPDDLKKVDLRHIEKSVLMFLSTFLSGDFANSTTGYPFVVKVALLGTNNLPFTSGNTRSWMPSQYDLPVRQPQTILALPEILIEDATVNLPHEMHAAFIRMWHAWAFASCHSYEHRGGVWSRTKG